MEGFNLSREATNSLKVNAMKDLFLSYNRIIAFNTLKGFYDKGKFIQGRMNRAAHIQSSKRVARNFWGQGRFLQTKAQFFGSSQSQS